MSLKLEFMIILLFYGSSAYELCSYVPPTPTKITFFKLQCRETFNKMSTSLTRSRKTQIQIEREEKSHYRTGLSVMRENYGSETTVLFPLGVQGGVER